MLSRLSTTVAILVGMTPLFSQELENVHVLPFKTKKEIVSYMKATVAKSLGVKCKYCHNVKDFPSDRKKHKKIGREMMKMVETINKNTMAGLKYKEVTCWTCHRGTTYPERSEEDTGKEQEHKH